MTMAVKRNHYDDEFKRESVRLLVESGKPVTTVASSIGIEQSNLHKWQKKFGHEFEALADEHGPDPAQLTEIDSLKKEVALLREDVSSLRAIVKKAFDSKRYLDETLM